MVFSNANIKFENFAESKCALDFLGGAQLYWEGVFKVELD